jgi:hypothetical protein
MKKTFHWVHTHKNSKCNPYQHIKSNNHLYWIIIINITITGVKKLYSAVYEFCSVFWKNTKASWECANDKAHRRKYEAVLEIAPKTY